VYFIAKLYCVSSCSLYFTIAFISGSLYICISLFVNSFYIKNIYLTLLFLVIKLLVLYFTKYSLNHLSVADLVNQGISTARRMCTTCIIGLSINKDLKLKKRKRRDKQQRKKIYTIPGHMRVI
jgi:hypothetical protein